MFIDKWQQMYSKFSCNETTIQIFRFYQLQLQGYGVGQTGTAEAGALQDAGYTMQ